MTELQTLPKWRGFVLLIAAFFGLAAGLCTLFALVVTAAQAWQEHAHAHWPQATAQVQQCALRIYTHRRESYRIDCTVSYSAQGTETVSHVYSRSTPAPSRVIAQYPPNPYEMLQDWVDAHPKGTPIAVHYDPANHSKAVLVVTDMPLAGPSTPSNLKLLAASAASFIVLLTIVQIARPRSKHDLQT
jgi:hypothetical protein